VKNLPIRLCVFAAAAAVFAFAGCSRRTEAVAPSVEPADSVSVAAKPGWLTSYEQAEQKARADNKLLLLDFTGSDWCGWCIKIDKEIFSKPAFKEYASKNLVLLEIDFPMRRQVPAVLKAQNSKLAGKYEIQGFPTIVVLNSQGKKVGELGYVEGGPAAFIAELEKIPKG
jgi:protein disulfide-isomerase